MQTFSYILHVKSADSTSLGSTELAMSPTLHQDLKTLGTDIHTSLSDAFFDLRRLLCKGLTSAMQATTRPALLPSTIEGVQNSDINRCIGGDALVSSGCNT